LKDTGIFKNLHLVGNREQGTGNREQGTGNREQGTGNREQGTGNPDGSYRVDTILFRTIFIKSKHRVLCGIESFLTHPFLKEIRPLAGLQPALRVISVYLGRMPQALFSQAFSLKFMPIKKGCPARDPFRKSLT
jgi:hypothetical protein